ncbi:ABC transporter ATP-binding protein [Gangjinia marincola]|uniref:ABC transporter ATP-binding protein n=1 Tax=Gangjinia marincola TaxID=578463 RepID=A0ABP3XSB5_9FLAO
MGETILKVDQLSKQYRLGQVGTGSLNDDVKRFVFKALGKEDPFSKVGAENDRSKSADTDYVWALRDINFEVKKGEVLGIIGRNGAGKSTLLKILSRVTGPTEGTVKSRGRIASLLEVGTGFHEELTGRENIFLNGAILGMTKPEIASKLNEIIEFSGCQMFIDTPVKRYSSGMRVRLAFAVAAHLEPDILVVDEVLAVGDAEFQKKAIGKMQDISTGGGRTVLFVSHNMASVKSLCTRAIVLHNGTTVFDGNVDQAVNYHLNGGNDTSGITNYDFAHNLSASNTDFELKHFKVQARNKDVGDPISREDDIVFTCSMIKKTSDNINIVLKFKDDSGNFLFTTNFREIKEQTGPLETELVIPKLFLNEETFYVDFLLTNGRKSIFSENDIVQFVVIQDSRELGQWMGKSPGPLKPSFNWKLKQLSQ